MARFIVLVTRFNSFWSKTSLVDEMKFYIGFGAVGFVKNKLVMLIHVSIALCQSFVARFGHLLVEMWIWFGMGSD
jgi:hypothetical protein